MPNDSRLDAFLERVRRASGAQERRAEHLTDEIRDHLITSPCDPGRRDASSARR
jgi:hypothetical protein